MMLALEGRFCVRETAASGQEPNRPGGGAAGVPVRESFPKCKSAWAIKSRRRSCSIERTARGRVAEAIS